MKPLAITLLMILSFLLSSPAFGQCADTCNIYSFTYAEKSYEIVQELRTWEQASACAVERGGYLVHIDSLEEQTAIYDAITASGISSTYISVGNGGSIAYIWIGATDKSEEGTWLWDGDNDGTGDSFWTGQGANGADDGSAVDDSYVNWGGTSAGTFQEPDDYNDNQDGAAIGLTGWPSGTTLLGVAGEWNDIIISSSIYYIVEYDILKPPVGECTPPDFWNNYIDGGSAVKLYPNPSQGIVNIDFGESVVQNEKVEVFNAYGTLIQNLYMSDSNPNILDLTGHPGGVYFLKLHTGNGTVVKKVFLIE